MVEARVMHSVGPVAPPRTAGPRYLVKALGLGQVLPVRGFFAKPFWRKNMDTTTLLIIIVVLLLLGGGWYGRGRWY